MNRSLRLPATAILLAFAVILAGCKHGDHPTDVIEGEALELGELSYNVKMTRFLNPKDEADGEYLGVAPELERDTAYLGTFIEISNDGDVAESLPEGISIVDTRGQRFTPVEFESLFALDLGAEVPAEGETPSPDSAAAHGTVGGAILLFIVPEEVSENRPLRLEIPGPHGETGTVELDI